jgi:hypothetical protein
VLRTLLPAGVDAYALLVGMRQAERDQMALSERDREGVRRLREHIGTSMSYTEVPAFDQDVHDLGSLAEVGHHLLGPLAA